MKKKIITFTALALMLSNQSEARDQIQIVGGCCGVNDKNLKRLIQSISE